MPTPEQLRTDEVVRFVASAIADRRRVLEVGCGRGHVARALARLGFSVTALDLELRDVVEAPGVTYVASDFLHYKDQPFDAIVFTSSLHHIAPLAAAIDRAVELLAPEGLFVADEFDLEAPDVPTLRWYHDVQQLLVAAGAYEAEQDHGHAHGHPHSHSHGHGHGHGTSSDLVGHWHDEHEHDPRLHTGAEMRAAIAERLHVTHVARLEYLYRYIASRCADDERGGAVAATVLEIERRLVADELIRPVGLRIVASR